MPAAKTAKQAEDMVRAEGAAVRQPARVKAGAAVADRDKAAAQDGVAVNILQRRLNPNKEDRIMPGFDRSGPVGAGPMTGGRRGLCGCAGGPADRPVYGGGMGFRRGFGRGRGRCFGPAYGGYPYPPVYGTGYPASRTDELEMLRANADAMRKSLETIQRRIAELEKEGSE